MTFQQKINQRLTRCNLNTLGHGALKNLSLNTASEENAKINNTLNHITIIVKLTSKLLKKTGPEIFVCGGI